MIHAVVFAGLRMDAGHVTRCIDKGLGSLGGIAAQRAPARQARSDRRRSTLRRGAVEVRKPERRLFEAAGYRGVVTSALRCSPRVDL